MLTADAFGVLPPIAQAHARAGHVSLPLGLYRQGGGHRARRDGAAGHLLHLLRRALHSARSAGLWQSAARPHRQARRRLLARQHRLDGRRLWRGPPHADQGHARAAERRTRRPPRTRADAHRPEFRLRRAGACRGRRPARSSTRAKPGPIPRAYDAMARKLVGMFVKNFAQFEAKVRAEVKAASPAVQIAAE